MNTRSILASCVAMVVPMLVALGCATPDGEDRVAGGDEDLTGAPFDVCHVKGAAPKPAEYSGVTVEQCASNGTSGAELYDELKITNVAHQGPSVSDARKLGNVSTMYIKLNGVEAFFAMKCVTSVSGSNGGVLTCKATIRSATTRAVDASEGPAVDANLFKYARREATEGEKITANAILNAWDVSVAFAQSFGADCAKDGSMCQWDSLGGANFNFRFEERDVRK
jgi:hypothetical protein